jgi:hypothetical protein
VSQTNETKALETLKKLCAGRYNLFLAVLEAPLTMGAIATCCISLMKQLEILTAKLISKTFNC